MKTNDAALALIREFEGLRTSWYKDPVGVQTVCYGHTDAAGSPKYADTKGKTFTAQECAAILADDLGQYEAAVDRLVTVPLTENQFGALVSFTYNLGAANLASSTLLKKLNAGDYAGAAAEFGKWNKAGGKTLAGLTRRRDAERALFEKGGERPLLKLGDKGDDVRDLQMLLAARGLYRWAVDGDFGNRTDATVRYFQALEGLTIDGKAGAQVWTALGV